MRRDSLPSSRRIPWLLLIVPLATVLAGLALGSLVDRAARADSGPDSLWARVGLNDAPQLNAAPAGPNGVPARISTGAIVVIGDSLSTGFGTSPKQAWPALLSRHLAEIGNPRQLINAAQNGSGYVAQGAMGQRFMDQVELRVNSATGTVVFFGSDNDLGVDPGTLYDAARATVLRARELAPAARIVVVGPPAYSSPASGGREQIRDDLKTAARSTAVQFVDPIAGAWMSESSQTLLGPDAEHPSVVGHAALERRFAELLG